MSNYDQATGRYWEHVTRCIRYHPQMKKFEVSVKVNGKAFTASVDTKEEAIRMRDDWVEKRTKTRYEKMPLSARNILLRLPWNDTQLNNIERLLEATSP